VLKQSSGPTPSDSLEGQLGNPPMSLKTSLDVFTRNPHKMEENHFHKKLVFVFKEFR